MISVEYITNWGADDEQSKTLELSLKALDKMIHLDQFFMWDTDEQGNVIMANDRDDAIIFKAMTAKGSN